MRRCARGPQGDPGPAGPQGNAGQQGDPAVDGSDGAQGIPGVDGVDGAAGPQGIPGTDGVDGAAGPQGIPGTDGVSPIVTVTTENVSVAHATGCTAESGVQNYDGGATITQINTGRWQVTFDTAHPEGAVYPVTFGNTEEGNLRDANAVQIIEGTQDANGFQVMMTNGDNGGTADTYNDEPWCFSAFKQTQIVTDVVVI